MWSRRLARWCRFRGMLASVVIVTVLLFISGVVVVERQRPHKQEHEDGTWPSQRHYKFRGVDVPLPTFAKQTIRQAQERLTWNGTNGAAAATALATQDIIGGRRQINDHIAELPTNATTSSPFDVPTPPADDVDMLAGVQNGLWAGEPQPSEGHTLPWITMPWGTSSWVPMTETQESFSPRKKAGSWWFDPRVPLFHGLRCAKQPSPWLGDHSAFVVQPEIGASTPRSAQPQHRDNVHAATNRSSSRHRKSLLNTPNPYGPSDAPHDGTIHRWSAQHFTTWRPYVVPLPRIRNLLAQRSL